MTIKVGVLGAAGWMGSTTCRTVEDDPELELVAKVGRDDDLQGLVEGEAEVAVDFTIPAVVKDHIKFCLDNDIHAVVGTTGLKQEDFAEIEMWAKGSQANCFIAPNFAVGAILMMQFAAKATPHFASAEIIERHHENKQDAPSGTAMRTARLMNEARDDAWTEPADETELLPGSRGGRADGIHIHSLRMPGSIAHQEVVFGAPGETLTIKHDSLDRISFMPGVVLAVKSVADRPGLTVGLEHLLDL